MSKVVKEEVKPLESTKPTHPKKLPLLSNAIQKLTDLFNAGLHQDALEAERELATLLESGNVLEADGTAASTQSLSYIEYLSSKQHEMLNKGDEIRTYMINLIPQLGSWEATKVKNPPGYDGTLYYKKDSSSGKLQIVTEIYMPWKMSEIASLMYEADLTPKWVKASSRQTVKLTSNPMPYVISFTNYITFPFPLDNRWGNYKSIGFVGDNVDSIC